MNNSSHIPDSYNAVMPALAIQDTAKAIEWYKNVFGAIKKMILKDNEGKIVHGEIVIDGSVLMVSEENLQYNKSPRTLNGNTVNLCVYVRDVDTLINSAVSKGAKLIFPASDQFYGDRSGRFEDPFGYIWIVSTHIKDISAGEMQKIMDEEMNAGN